MPEHLGLLLFFALVGLFAGGVRAAQRVAPRPVLRDVVTQAAGGALTAFVAGCACLWWWDTTRMYLSIMIAGIAGWIGTLLLDKAAVVLELWAAQRLPAPAQPTQAAAPPPLAATVTPPPTQGKLP